MASAASANPPTMIPSSSSSATAPSEPASRVWMRLRGYWMTADQWAKENDPTLRDSYKAMDFACSYPGCILCEKHHGPHEFEDDALQSPTVGKRKAGMPSKFLGSVTDTCGPPPRSYFTTRSKCLIW